ncbi:hypothetical protein M885DRAFT_526297 [Pelagophyceae sp. CCMP2097]|nr:hypothetical protein M885DRAFT_526297 [Pelagophyceae sp. CCMP2097]
MLCMDMSQNDRDGVDEDDDDAADETPASRGETPGCSQDSGPAGAAASAAKPARKRGAAIAALPAEVPLVLTPNAAREGRNTLLVELDARAGSLARDTGAIGRASFPRGSSGFVLDLRGQEYVASVRRSNTFMIVSVGAAEAKIECLLSEYVDLDHTRDALATLGDGAVLHGELDEGYRHFHGDVDVNRRQRAGKDGDDAEPADGEPKKKPAKAAKEVPKKKARKKK